MNKLHAFAVTVLSTFFFCFLQVPCHAADTMFKEIAKDSLYGGIAGTLIGAATLAFAHKPGDHLEYMAYGAAAGLVGGATYGYFSSRALMEVENGKVKFAIPTVMPDKKDSSRTTTVVVTTQIIKGKF